MVQNTQDFGQAPAVSTTSRGIADPNYVETHEHTLHGHTHPHWGSIFAGIFVALSTLAVLSALGAAIGSSAYDRGDDLRGYGMGAGIWALISALVSFAVGGFVAARTSGHHDRNNGLFHGLMVWAVTIPLLALLVGSGISRLAAGAASNDMAPNVARNTADRSTMSADDAKHAAQKAAWGTLASLLLGLGAAAIGGHLGARGLPRATTTTTPRT